MQDINDKINNMHMGKLIHMLSHEMKRNHPIDKVIQDDLTIMQKHILKFILLETMHRDLYQKDIEEEFQIRKSTVTGYVQLMEKNGYHRYEISNYAKEGYACRHNLGYWERIPYLGFGIGAASLVPGDLIGKCRKLEGKMSRYTNPDQLREYAHSYRNKFQAELLTETEEMEEFMFLGLRKMNGISKKEFSEYFGKSLEDIYGEPICKLESLKLLEQDDDRVWLTKRGIDVSNSVFVEFLLEE